jgi:hypothetical protein
MRKFLAILSLGSLLLSSQVLADNLAQDKIKSLHAQVKEVIIDHCKSEKWS